MSKNKSYQFFGTIGDIVDLIKSLPTYPIISFLKDWNEFVIEVAMGHTAAREFYHKITKLRVRFDPAKEGTTGFEALDLDHWHIRNPNTTGKKDRYLDINGNPVAKGSNASHIIPKN